MNNYLKFTKLNICVVLIILSVMTFTGCDEDNSAASGTTIVVENNTAGIQVINDMKDPADFTGQMASGEMTPNSSAGLDDSDISGDLSDEEANIDSDASDGNEDNSDSDKSDAGDFEDDETDSDSASIDETAELKDDENTEDDEASADGQNSAEDENSSISSPVDIAPGSTQTIAFNPEWQYAQFSEIHSGAAVLYTAPSNRKGIVIGVNAGHGTKGGTSVKTYCHPDMTPKVTGGSTAAGSVKAIAVSGGMSFYDGTAEATVTLRMAQIFRDKLLAAGYDVLMIRDGADVQLDNVARTLMANNNAACHIAIHWDGDNLSYDKGCFFMSTPDGIKGMEPVASTWTKSEALGQSVISGLSSKGCKIYKNGAMAIDLTQTSYSTVPSIDIELGNAASVHDDASLSVLADGMVAGVNSYFNQ